MSDSNSKERLDQMRHTLAHILGAASVELKSESRLGVGFPIEGGFYQDIGVDENYTEADLKKLEKKMRGIVARNLPIVQKELPKEEARKLYHHDPFKLELIDDVEGDVVGISVMGPDEKSIMESAKGVIDGYFPNLCRGGHASSTGDVGAFTLTRLAGVYWRSDETNPQIQRIYGVAFPTQEELDEHLAMLEEAKKRDHRKLGKELDLFTFSELVGSGLPLWTPRGTVVRNLLDDFVWELRRDHGYEKVEIPHITKKDLFERSGHWGKFGDELFKIATREGHEFAMKPMNCPFHTQIFDRKIHSYKEMPQRYANTTMVYRDEQTGELQGLSRVRSITQDDAHVFCRESQVVEEAAKIWDIIDSFYSATGFGDLRIRLSLRDLDNLENYQGDDAIWERSEQQLRELIMQKGVDFEEGLGEAAFYGPKIDFMSRDSLGREWQVATIQIDRTMPENFDLACVNEDGDQERVVMLHAAIMGAIERFMSVLLEHHAGALPLWLSPIQVAVLPISDEQLEYSHGVVEQLRGANLRAEVDDRSESIGKKIREAETGKVPVMLIVGKQEVADETVSVRSRVLQDGESLSLTEFLEELSELNGSRR